MLLLQLSMLALPMYAQIVDHNDLDEDFAMLTMKPLSHGGDIVDLSVTENDGDNTLFIDRDASDQKITQMGDVKLTMKQASSDPVCQYVASVSDKQGRTIEIEGTGHKLVVQIVRGKHRQVMYRNSVFEAEETLGLMGQFFVEAENNQEEDEEQTTGLVHVGSDLSHGGRSWLLENHDLEKTQAMFQKQVSAMLADEHSNLVPLASAAMLKTGIDVNSFFCSRPFHTFASIVGKTKLRKKDLSFIEAWERSVIKLNAIGKANSSAQLDAGGWDGVSGRAWDSDHARRPYSDCGSDSLGQCGLPGQCWETASGCPGCGCMRGCEYHDHYCTCSDQGMSHHVCYRMSFGGWEHCEPCVGPGARERDNTRRRRFYN